MINKTIIQIFLLTLIFLSLIIFYNKYLQKKTAPVTIKENNEIIENKEMNSNLIYNLSYKSTDIDKNEYVINSKSGEMSQNGSEFFMNIVRNWYVFPDQQIFSL